MRDKPPLIQTVEVTLEKAATSTLTSATPKTDNLNMKTFFIDTESCGLYGVPVLLQYAIGRGKVKLIDLWCEKIVDVLHLIEDMVGNRTVAHNINFDWQMLQKFYNMMVWARTNTNATKMEDLTIEQMVESEWQSQFGKCLKPAAAVDTMILAAKSDGQSALMAAKPIYIRRIPTEYGQQLADELTARTNLPWILFARKKVDPFAKWVVSERKDDSGKVDSQFVDVMLKFAPSNGLKELHSYLFGVKGDSFADVMPEEFPVGEGFCPYVKPLLERCVDGIYHNLKNEPVGRLWPSLIRDHIEFWSSNRRARRYGERDITMLRDLYEHFDSPENDEDAILACQIASVRLYGFKLDLDTMAAERQKSIDFVAQSPINVNSPSQVKEYIAEALDPMEQIIVAKSANAETLERIAKEFTLEEAEDCECEDQKFCVRCGGTGRVGPGPMVVALRAKLVEEVRTHKKRVELFDKLLLAGRAYPNFRAVGTKSGRLSGTDGLNFQGIDKSYLVRSMFTLCDAGEVLSGGDYDGQEVAIAGTTMNDQALLDEMKKGKKIHGLFAVEMFPPATYEEILQSNTDGTDPMKPTRYDRGKSAVFLTIYGGTAITMAERAGISVEIAEAALNGFMIKYPGVGQTKKMINDRFSAIHRNPEGKMDYIEPKVKYIESIFGFRRYFNTEFKLQRMIFDVIEDLFDKEKKHTGFIERLQNDQRTIVRDTKKFKQQTMSAAIASALIGACYSIGNGVIRAANNHLIQSAGRKITVGLQLKLWELQPVGIHEFRIRPMSVHDEVAAVSKADMVEDVTKVVVDTLNEQCEIVPLLQMDWGRHLPSWGEMKKVKLKTHDAVHAGIALT